jgi:hypothetical protein
MKHSVITNIPQNPKEIMDEALKISFNNWIDEKGTKDNPGVWKREFSKLTYEEAYDIIQNNKPHWGICFRNMSYISSKEEDYWEFGGCNIGKNDYGEVFIWIKVKVEDALKIIKKYNLIQKEY